MFAIKSFLCFIFVCTCVEANRRAICEIDGVTEQGIRGDPGPAGPQGIPGEQGMRGEPGDCSVCAEALQRLESQIENLQRQIDERDWSRWGSWSTCTSQRNCGTGKRSRTRTCLFSPNAEACSGSNIKSEVCQLPSCQASTMLLNKTFGPVFIYDRTASSNNKWKGVGENEDLSLEARTGIHRTVCRNNGLSLAYIPDSANEIFTDEIYLQPLSCNNDEIYLPQCLHDGWKPHPDCQKQLQVLCTDIQHYHVASNEITWTKAKRFCRSSNKRLCSYSEIFPNNDNIPIITGILEGDHWAPLRSPENDWAEIGNSHNRMGWTHIQHYGPPPWGETVTNNHWKGNFFCCPLQ